MNKLYVVRHGETDWNKKRMIQGRTDIELNDTGIKQVLSIRDKINLDNIDLCIASPMLRVKKTASLITQDKINIIYDNLLLERSYGDYEGHLVSFEVIKTLWDYKLNYNKNNIESIRELLDRANKFLTKINKEYQDKNILIVSHAGFIKALHFCINGYNEDEDFLSFKVDNASIYEYII